LEGSVAFRQDHINEEISCHENPAPGLQDDVGDFGAFRVAEKGANHHANREVDQKKNTNAQRKIRQEIHFFSPLPFFFPFFSPQQFTD